LFLQDTDGLDVTGNTLAGAGTTNTVGLFLTDGSDMEIDGNDISGAAFGFFENITQDGLVPNQIGALNSYAAITDTTYSLLVDPTVTDAVTRAGTDGNDGFIGSVGADIFVGNAGDDFLFGDAGDDDLSGGQGNDIVEGAFGADVLSGGAGT
ncbi:MAG: calcium-binding protein, partial [Paracoccaceae bacterium]